MSPEAGALLLHQIVPRIASAVPVAVPSVGSEDREELIQDGTAMAAKILINAQRNGKKVTPGNVAYYTLQHLKSGRRTVGFSSVDVLAAGTQLQCHRALQNRPVVGGSKPARARWGFHTRLAKVMPRFPWFFPERRSAQRAVHPGGRVRDRTALRAQARVLSVATRNELTPPARIGAPPAWEYRVPVFIDEVFFKGFPRS